MRSVAAEEDGSVPGRVGQQQSRHEEGGRSPPSCTAWPKQHDGTRCVENAMHLFDNIQLHTLATCRHVAKQDQQHCLAASACMPRHPFKTTPSAEPWQLAMPVSLVMSCCVAVPIVKYTPTLSVNCTYTASQDFLDTVQRNGFKTQAFL
jgi:hypothetical protein